jgi:ArsR family transcriptional regulator, arsenate/arsenite/antimonite-responsive transcriptional repressor
MTRPGPLQLNDRQLALISKALGDPKRFQILQRIGASREAPTCTCIREWTGLAPATVSHHLKELENAGLVKIERHAKFAYVTLRRDVWVAYLNRLSSL